MTKKEAQKIALEDSKKKGGNYALFAGVEDNFYYFSCGNTEAPKYNTLPWAIRINPKGKLEELKGLEIRLLVSKNAKKLRN